MSVAHLASSEFPTGITGSINEASFTWPHTPGGTPRGVTVCVWTSGNAGVSLALGVTYQGVTVPAVSGAEAIRTTGEAGNMKVFHLGAGVPTANPATIIVTRTNNAVEMWGASATQSADVDTEIYEAGIVLDQSAGAATEKLVSDASSGPASLRYAAAHSGYDAPPTVGPNTTMLHSIDIGAVCGAFMRETVAGAGARLVGIEEATSSSKAIVHFAVREIIPGVLHLGQSESHPSFTGSFNEGSFTWPHTPGGTPRGATVFVWTSGNNGVTLATGVTYGGVTVPAVEGGESSRIGTEAGNMKAFHLGSAVPAASPATVVVTRTNNAVVLWACCVTQLAGTDTEVYTPGIVVQMGAGASTEASVHDGNPGRNSLRYSGGHFGYDTPPTAGPNTTHLHDMDIGSVTAAVGRETVPGQGLRPVGYVETAFAAKAVVNLAIREIVSLPGADLYVMVYGSFLPQSPIGGGPGVLPALSKFLPSEVLHITRTLSINRSGATTVTFTASPDHAAVTDYTAVLYTYPAHTVAGSLSLGVPTPDASNNITADLAPLFAGKAAGDYTVVIQTTSATGGPIPSEDSNVFTLPVA